PAVEAAALLVEGLERGGAEAAALPVADGGEGTAEGIGGGGQGARVSGPPGRPVRAQWVGREDGTARGGPAAALRLPPLRPGRTRCGPRARVSASSSWPSSRGARRP